MSDEINDLIAEARFYESPGHVAAYAEGTLELLRKLADALEAATREQDSAGDIRRAVRLWSERFIPGDRWDTEDAHDLDAALKCVVEANPDRSRARVPVQGEPNDERERIAAILQLRHPGNMYSTCERDADAILAAGFSRAAVPDAVIEGMSKKAEAFDKAVALSERRQTLLEEAEAERDAALAAIERVRAALSAWEMVQARNREYLESGNPGMIVPIDCTGGLRAALDGAPEPECLSIPIPNVPFGPEGVAPTIATASYLIEVVKKIDFGYANVGGSNVTATLRKLLVDTAEALRGLPVEGGSRE